MKFNPPPLPSNSTADQWRQCFIEGLVINEINDDGLKLTFLRLHAGHELFAILKSVTTFNDALSVLDAQFRRPTRILFARHQLLSCRQKPDEKADLVNVKVSLAKNIKFSSRCHRCRSSI